MSLVETKYKINDSIEVANYLNETFLYDESEIYEGNFFMLLKEDYTQEKVSIEGYEDFVNMKIIDAEKNETQLTEKNEAKLIGKNVIQLKKKREDT